MTKAMAAPRSKSMSPLGLWIYSVLVAVDQLGNALAGGAPNVRISTRVGFHCQHKRAAQYWYWNSLRAVIDFTFFPIDGPDHCARAYQADSADLHENGSDAARVILSLVVIFFCALLVPAVRLLALLGFVRKTAVT